MDLSVLLALVGIIVVIIIAVWSSQVKYISYEIITNNPLINIEEGIANEIKILYRDEVVENVNLLVLKIKNSGNVRICSDDFESGINISLKNGGRVLFSEIIERVPKDINIEFENQDNSIYIKPLLINKQESFTLKSLVDSGSGEVDINSRIKGTKILPKGESPKELKYLIYFSRFIAILITYIYQVYYPTDIFNLIIGALILSWIINNVFISILGLEQ